MIGLDFGLAAGVMAILGLVVYLIACAYHRVLPPIEKPVEALGFGGLIAVWLALPQAISQSLETRIAHRVVVPYYFVLTIAPASNPFPAGISPISIL
jgi:hypothetical protein